MTSELDSLQHDSIKGKLVRLNSRLLASVVGGILLIAAVAAMYGINSSLKTLEDQVMDSLIQKGLTLVSNNAIALSGMVSDNAFLSVSELVSITVEDDPDIIFGVFMDDSLLTWVDTRQNIEIQPHFQRDHIALQAAKSIHARFQYSQQKNHKLIEFYAPVFFEDERVGTIRYSIDTTGMQEHAKKMKQSSIQVIITVVGMVLGVSLLFLYFGAKASKRQAQDITTPLRQLIEAADVIIYGDYSQTIAIQCNDEVGILANQFERMRCTIKEYTDELENKVKERTLQLEEAQKEALENAHRAGMADIATGTLHNVGNILNSVVTSAGMIQETFKNTQVSGLIKANNMLEENHGNIGDFMSNNPKGKKLITYYLKLGKALSEEHKLNTEHLARLQDKIDVISQAISAQQSYAKRSTAMFEPLLLSKSIDDALLMCASSVERHKIDIIKNYQDCDTVSLPRNKIVQVIVNLIKNAKDAIKEAKHTEGTIKIKVWQNDDRILASIEDNGIGIEDKDLTKIFHNEFSTKPDGHGFGLHSCANYMTEMEGRISVESEGLYKGTRFTLDFPAAITQDRPR